jgi:DNA-binding NtrC family response regulator
MCLAMSKGMPTSPTLPAASPPAPPKPAPGFHGAVTEFKRRLIEATLFQLGGNRTRTARALGLQRTYLLRLIREFGVNVPHREPPPRRSPPPVPGGR